MVCRALRRFISGWSCATLNSTSANRRSTIRTSSTDPTTTPAIRTSSPRSSPLASVKRAVFEVRAPPEALAMVRASTVVPSATTTASARNLTSGPNGIRVM
jgi:hypothetical protein